MCIRDRKTVICEIVEAIEYDELKTFSAWENKTQEVIALQNKWKTIGFAPLVSPGNASERLFFFAERHPIYLFQILIPFMYCESTPE